MNPGAVNRYITDGESIFKEQDGEWVKLTMPPELERKVNTYAHDYRNMCMNEDELATMLKVALLEAYELGRKEVKEDTKKKVSFWLKKMGDRRTVD
jgi:hypothetical protein